MDERIPVEASPAEEQILSVLWQARMPLQLRDIAQGVANIRVEYGGKAPAPTTVSTALARMLSKGLIEKAVNVYSVRPGLAVVRDVLKYRAVFTLHEYCRGRLFALLRHMRALGSPREEIKTIMTMCDRWNCDEQAAGDLLTAAGIPKGEDDLTSDGIS